MKTIEEKAKAYDKAIEKAKSKIKNDKDHILYEDDIIDIFSELKESEDERIRGELLTFFRESIYGGHILTNKEYDSWIAWLERQDKQQDVSIQINPSEYINDIGGNGCYLKSTDNVEQKFKVGDTIRLKNGDGLEWTVEEVLNNGYYTIVCADRDDFIQLDDNWELVEQRSANKVEPKFHKGEWIVWQDKCYKVNYNGCGYELVDQDGLSTSLEYGTIDEHAHLWTIQDAKDGDVLAYRGGQWIFIFKEIENNNSIIEYYALLSERGLETKNAASTSLISAILPATKEQREQLEKAITEAGYIFDFEKKELKKIEQKPWSEEDENIRLRLIDYLYGKSRLTKDREDGISWLKSLKDRVQPQNTWKPSEEQINALEYYIYSNSPTATITKGTIFGNMMVKLLEQLKKLKE